jgi:hypothetical protein
MITNPRGELRVRPAPSNHTPADIPPDVEARYREIQEEMQRLDLSPEATHGETREARFERRQRLKALRSEFDSMARVPLARRQRQRTGMTVLLMAGMAVLLCVLSVGGGIALENILSRQPDLSSVATGFMDAIKAQDYSTAHSYIPSDSDAQAFGQKAEAADSAYGPVTGYLKISQTGGASGQTNGTITYQVSRNAGGQGLNGSTPTKIKPYIVIIQFVYTGNSWSVLFYGNLFSPPTS